MMMRADRPAKFWNAKNVNGEGRIKDLITQGKRRRRELQLKATTNGRATKQAKERTRKTKRRRKMIQKQAEAEGKDGLREKRKKPGARQRKRTENEKSCRVRYQISCPSYCPSNNLHNHGVRRSSWPQDLVKSQRAGGDGRTKEGVTSPQHRKSKRCSAR